MIEAVLLVLTKAKPGRGADMDDWYSNIHIRDALRFRGSIAAQRFRLSSTQPMPLSSDFGWQFLALYNVFDAPRFSQEHWENALTSRMKISDAIDDSVLYDYHFYPIQFRSNAPARRHDGGIVLEQMRPTDGREEEYRSWYNDEYLPAAARRSGVASAAFLAFDPTGQMIPSQPDHKYVGLYRLDDEHAAGAWETGLGECPLIDQSSLTVTAWEPITPRLTKDDVQHPTSAGLAAEEAARERMGDRIVTTGAEKLGAA